MRLNILAILIAVTVGTLSVSAQQAGAAQSSQPTPQAVRNYGHLPLTFEANQGQAAGQVKFLSRGHGYSTLLTAGGMVLNLRASHVESASNKAAANSQASTHASLQFHLIGANSNPQVVGEDPQPGRVNYFIGKDASKWHTNVPTYGKIRYKNIYPGIDLIYYGNHQQLEYDFAVAPGADPRKIQFQINGANQISLDEQGDLVLNVNGAKLHFQSPVVYQESNGKRVPVTGGYAMMDESHIGFQVSNFDASKPLVIDPVLVYSTYLGGSGTDQPTGIAVDNSGNVYVAGYSDSADFPLASMGSLATNTDHVFVAKMDATGANLIYADYIGGNSDDYAVALVLDSANEVYVTGSTQSSNFPVVGAYQSQQPGPYTGFVTRISADGSVLMYSTYLGGNNYDQPSGIAIDNSGEVTVAGYTQSQNFPVSSAFQATAQANQGGIYGTYGFLTKFAAGGSSLVYSTYFAGNANVEEGGCCWVSPFNTINAVASDSDGNVYVTGTTNTYNFPVTTGSYATTNSSQQNANVAFVSKFNSAGGLDYSTYFYDASGYPVSTAAIAVDSTGSAYVTGSAYSDSTFPVTSTSICNPSSSGLACSYAFVTKFNPAASALTYSTFLGANNNATPQSIALDASNDAYVLASASSASFAEVNGIEAYDSQDDVMLVEIDPDGASQIFATYIGGSGDDEPSGIAVDGDGNMYVAGSTDSSDLPTTQGAFQTVVGGNTDGFIAKIGPVSAPAVSLAPYSLQFAATAVSSTSAPQTILLRNMGSATLSISSIAATGNFAENNDCGSSVAAAGSCTISVTFTPTAQGASSGSITVEDDASGTPHTVALSGVGEGGSSGSPSADAVLTPGSLTFSSTPVGRSGLSQSVTLTNAGNASLTISNIQASGDFSQSNTCSSSLSAGSSCSITVLFTPTAEGTRTGTLTVSDNSQVSTQTVSLTGTGTAGTLVLGLNSLAFSSVQVGSSVSQSVTVSNTGNAPASINGIQVTGNYTQINNCPSPINGGTSCTITVAFVPTTSGPLTGALTLTSGAQNTQQTVSLAGTGLQADLVVNPVSLTFSTPLGTLSATQAVILKNSGNISLSLSGVQIAGDYKDTNNCGATLTAGASCTVTVAFNPTATGTRSGTLTVTDSAGNPQTIVLSGAASDFSLSSTAITSSIQPGASATYTLTASAVGTSFPDAVALSCSGLPAHATCSFSPSSITPGASKATTTLTISTTDSIAENTPEIPVRQKPMNGLWMQVQGLGLVGMVLANGKKRSRKTAILVLLVLLVLGMLFMTGCAGGTGIAPQTPNSPQSYTITVTGTSGSLQHSVPVTFTVQ